MNVSAHVKLLTAELTLQRGIKLNEKQMCKSLSLSLSIWVCSYYTIWGLTLQVWLVFHTIFCVQLKGELFIYLPLGGSGTSCYQNINILAPYKVVTVNMQAHSSLHSEQH